VVHIKKIDIFGFKSFGFRTTTVEFRPGLVSISGPNGSGKSNILDAIIFAMGENKPRMMRVDKLRSLIHDIDGKRRGPRIARASILFDNTDRKIPLGSDSVEITREMDGSGDNTYYVNKKKSQRNHVLDLLDVANAGLNQLNALQQGTVTRISEFTPEEKRKAIEDLVGLSYFDEKKQEAQKQLGDADHRLEIALTKMGEVKKYIDDLEAERNAFLRHGALEAEISRLNAIDAASRLRGVMAGLAKKREEAARVEARAAQRREEGEALASEMAALEAEKAEFAARADAHSRARAKVDTDLAAAYRAVEESKGALAAAERRAGQVGKRLPALSEELAAAERARSGADERAGGLRESLRAAAERRAATGARIEENGERLAEALARHSGAAGRAAEDERRAREATEERDAAALSASNLEREVGEIDARAGANASRRAAIAADIAKLESIDARLRRVIAHHSRSHADMRERIDSLGSRMGQASRDIDELGAIVARSERAATRYRAKMKVIKGIMHEDYSVSRLRANAREIGIEGVAYELVSWDGAHERAALAAGSEWLKAIVTRDIDTMVGIAEYARSRGMPRLKVIALGGIARAARTAPEGADGMLADHVRADARHAGIVDFLFGGVALARTPARARELAAAGHRAVTLDGELFEPGAAASIMDAGSRITDLTRRIAMGATVDGLLQSIAMLKQYAERKAASRERMAAAQARARARLLTHESGIVTSRSTHEDLVAKIAGARRVVRRIDEQNERLAKRRAYAASEIERLGPAVRGLEGRIAEIRGRRGEGHDALAAEVARLGEEKTRLEAEDRLALAAEREATSALAAAEADAERAGGTSSRLESERLELEAERAELAERAGGLRERAARSEAEVTAMREREQELISDSGESVSRLSEYDARLDGMRERERSISRDIASAQRQGDALGRDIGDLAASEASLRKVCAAHNVGEDAAGIDVAPLLRALRAELESMTTLNAGAPAKYTEVSGGYRETSAKKNSLEAERNGIVSFIEGVEREKRQTFLDAFDTVEKEIRQTFSKMTGGNAWIELENEDDIFSSGISYLIQFPNKPKRDSAAISGGEKSLAAIVFVLALQRLKPSPFYLFDEVDAHLDTPNSERLSKILSERAGESQFIVVSLKDSVVKKAALIYGVYPRGGVSHVVTYKDRRVPQVAA